MEKLHRIINGEKVFLTEEEEIAVRREWLDSELKEASTAYIEQRRLAYPPIEIQLDMIYNEGLDYWRAEIKKIKDKYPKP